MKGTHAAEKLNSEYNSFLAELGGDPVPSSAAGQSGFGSGGAGGKHVGLGFQPEKPVSNSSYDECKVRGVSKL